MILILVDAMRRDHVSTYGYSKPTTPAIDAIAREGILFENAVSASSWTQPAMASLFTSTYPSVHHVTRNPGKDLNLSVLSPELVTMAEFLRDQGLVTHAICSHPYLGPASGLDQGFLSFDHTSNLIETREAEKVMDQALAWIRTQPANGRFFLYLHLMGPHFPYLPPPEFEAQFTGPHLKEVKALFAGKSYDEQNQFMSGEGLRLFQTRPELLAELVGLYDAEVAFSDHQVQRLWEELKRRDWLSGTMLIICADHGEAFLEHGAFGHGNSLYAELVMVPLIIYYPPLGQGKRVGGLVSLLDVFPTLVELFGADPPPLMQGESLLRTLAGKKRPPPLSELHVLGLARITTEDYALIFRPRAQVQMNGVSSFQEQAIFLFDRKNDPGETINLAPQQTQIADQLLSTLLRLEEKNRELKVPPTRGKKLSPEQIKALKALGYLQGTSP